MASRSERSPDEQEMPNQGTEKGSYANEHLLIIPTVLSQCLSEQQVNDNNPKRLSGRNAQPIFNIEVETNEAFTPRLTALPSQKIQFGEPNNRRTDSSNSSQQMQTNPMNTSTMTFGPSNQVGGRDSGFFKWNELAQMQSQSFKDLPVQSSSGSASVNILSVMKIEVPEIQIQFADSQIQQLEPTIPINVDLKQMSLGFESLAITEAEGQLGTLFTSDRRRTSSEISSKRLNQSLEQTTSRDNTLDFKTQSNETPSDILQDHSNTADQQEEPKTPQIIWKDGLYLGSDKIEVTIGSSQREEESQFFQINVAELDGKPVRTQFDSDKNATTNSALNHSVSALIQSLKLNTTFSNLKMGEAAVQITVENQLTEEIIQQPASEVQQIMVNRFMEVDELNLRGLSSSESSTERMRKNQHRIRKPFNSFKEDQIKPLKIVAHNSQEFNPFGHRFECSDQSGHEDDDPVDLKKARKSKSRKPKKSKERAEEYPQLEHHKSQNTFTRQGDMNEMKQRYIQFNSHIQAQNRIEQLALQNMQLQRLLFSSQHDLRLLQRFMKSYFKQKDFLNKPEVMAADAETQQVLRRCFQDTPAVLLAFSSPLIRKVEDESTHRLQISEMAQLDFTSEFAGAIQGIKDARMVIKIGNTQATVEKLFRFCNEHNPVGIHFSGHGVANEPSMNGANCLVLETDDGCAHYLSEEQLVQLIKDMNAPLKFVFLASCHSEFAGFLFHYAGVEHVICVKQNEEIFDQAAIILARHFYYFLFSEQNTVCKAFERARLFLGSNPDKKISREASKFLMIKQSDDISERIPPSFFGASKLGVGKQRAQAKSRIHECKPLGPFQQGEIDFINHKPAYAMKIPVSEDKIIGRGEDIQAIVEMLIQKTPMVVVHGLVGIGKSAVIHKVGKFFEFRESFHDGVIYISMRDRHFVNILNFKLHAFIFQNRTDTDEPVLQKFSSQKSSQSETIAFEEIKTESNVENTILPELTKDFKKIVDQQKFCATQNSLQGKHCLIIVDNAHDLLENDEEQSSKFFETLLKNCPTVQVLISSNGQQLKSVPGTKFYHIGPLSPRHSIEILEHKSNHFITQHELRELLQKTEAIGKKGEGKQRVTRLENHNLCVILGGHQGTITLLAPFFQNRSLFEFYKLLLKMFEEPGLLRDVSQINPENTLKYSLNALARHFQKTNPLTIQLFGLIGLMPSGIHERDLDRVWGSDKWFMIAELLVQSSLILFKIEQATGVYQGQRKYRLMQFMNSFATDLLSQSKLQEFHERVSLLLYKKINYYFTNCCVEMMREKEHEHQNQVLEEEPNVWACINRVIDKNSLKEETSKIELTKPRKYLNFGTGFGYSSTDDQQLMFKSRIDIGEVEDTCDDNVTRFDRLPHPRARDSGQLLVNDYGTSARERSDQVTNSYSSEKPTDLSKINAANQPPKSPEARVSLKFKNALKKYAPKKLPAVAQSRVTRLDSNWEALENPDNIRIERRVSLQLSQIVKSQKKLQNEASPVNLAGLSDHESKSQESEADSNCAVKQKFAGDFSFCQDACISDEELNTSFQDDWTHRSNLSCSTNSFIEPISELQAVTTYTMQNPQDDPDRIQLQAQRLPSATATNFLDELTQHNRTFLEQDQARQNMKPPSSQIYAGQQELESEESKIGTNSLECDMAQLSIDADAHARQPKQQSSSNPSDMHVSHDNDAPSKIYQVPRVSSIETWNLSQLGFSNPGVAPISPINNPLSPELTEISAVSGTEARELQLQFRKNSITLSPIEERQFGPMTSEQLLIVTYISLLILQQRCQFALRTIHLVDQHMVNKLICHANLTKLYGLSILQLKQDRTKDAFEMFRRAKKIFKQIGGDNNKANMGVAQCYMIEATLLRTKSDQIFSPRQPNEQIVLKKAQKRFEAAKRIYKERQHLAGQLYCCQELLHVYKALKVKQLNCQNEHKELLQKLRGAYTEDSRLICGSGTNQHVFITRSDGLELSLLVEIIDHSVIVSAEQPKRQANPASQPKKQSNQIQNKPPTKPFTKRNMFSHKDFNSMTLEDNRPIKDGEKQQPPRVTNKALQEKAEKEFEKIKRNKQRFGEKASDEQSNEKLGRSGKYAHIQSKVITFRSNVDSTAKESPTEVHQASDEPK